MSPRTTVSSRAAVRRSSASSRDRSVRDDLGEHRVEPAGDLVAARHAGVDADPRPGRPAQLLDPPGRRQEPALRILGVQADLDRMARCRYVGLREPERLPGGDPQLVLDEVAPGHQLGDRMLDLEARVHLEEDGFAAVVDEELARSGAHVPDRARERERSLAQPPAEGRVDRRRRGLLEHLLVPPLDRAVALAEVDAVAVGVEQHLDLDVARPLEEALEDQAAVAEGRGRLAAGGGERIAQPIRVPHDPHALCRRRLRPA